MIVVLSPLALRVLSTAWALASSLGALGSKQGKEAVLGVLSLFESSLSLLGVDPKYWLEVESKIVRLFNSTSLAIFDAGEIIVIS